MDRRELLKKAMLERGKKGRNSGGKRKKWDDATLSIITG